MWFNAYSNRPPMAVGDVYTRKVKGKVIEPKLITSQDGYLDLQQESLRLREAGLRNDINLAKMRMKGYFEEDEALSRINKYTEEFDILKMTQDNYGEIIRKNRKIVADKKKLEAMKKDLDALKQAENQVEKDKV